MTTRPRKNHFAERLERAAKWKPGLQEQEQERLVESEGRWQWTARMWERLQKQMDEQE